MIDITGVNLVKFVQDVYDLSRPQGFGFLHFTPEPLSDSDAQDIVASTGDHGRIVFSTDYVRGRACKMTAFRNGDKIEIDDSWYDHSQQQLDELLSRHGIARTKPAMDQICVNRLIGAARSNCPNVKEEFLTAMDGERYRCRVCGYSYFLDYEDMK